MARILICRGSGAHFTPLANCLKPYHELFLTDTVADAMLLLKHSEVDLIISSVYDDTTDLFSFIRMVKQDSSLRDIPFLCFSQERTAMATKLDMTMEQAALVCGASRYLSMDSFCKAKEQTESCENCPFQKKRCDYIALRHAVEDSILYR